GHAHAPGGRPAPGHVAEPGPPADARPQADGRAGQRQRQDPGRLRAGRRHPQAPARPAHRAPGRRLHRRGGVRLAVPGGRDAPRHAGAGAARRPAHRGHPARPGPGLL
ncbi:MAG: Putative regulatory protein, partial [uncultured Blastococcus sp.]